MARSFAAALVVGILLLCGGATAAQDDPYLAYVRTAPEFQPVKQDPAVLLGRWGTWIYMPWRYQWTIGTDDAGGRFCQKYGFNGGFTDHGEGPFDWLDNWNLRFYNDHTAAKGFLYLRGANSKGNFAKYQRDARAVRSGTDGQQPIDAAMLEKLTQIVTRNVNNVKRSPMRVAYALDDEVSWGAFVVPLPWRIHADDAAYQAWLDRYYGGRGPKAQFVTPDFVLPQYGRKLAEIDLAPLLDRLTYNDSVWAVFLGKLVEAANKADPETPCGFVGAQAPNTWGGYDYAKLMKKVQFIEAYDIGSSSAIVRSLNPQNAMPVVTTHFHKDALGTANDIWQSWYYLAHGNRGMIGWVEGWFNGPQPRDWIAEYSPTLKELGGVQGPKLVGSRWVHDGVAIYYSHPSIQVSWCLDIQPHGRTWVNRGSDHRLGTSHLVRKAWENMLTDSGIQYDFLPYDRVVTEGVPEEYRVLVLPACYALSDVETQRLTAFCRRGGTVIADFGCGLFDQHGTGRRRGALDSLFGVTHDGAETSKDFFGAGKLWVETDQDAGFSYKKHADLFATVKCRLEKGYAVAEHRLPLGKDTLVGRGRAVYLNLSPQRYLQYREEGAATDAHRAPFIAPVIAGGAKPWIEVIGPDDRRPANCETTYWSKGGRTYVFVVQSAAVTGSPTGGGGAEGLVARKVPIEVRFPGVVRGVVDERSGQKMGASQTFRFAWNTAEAVLLSFPGAPPRP